MNEEFWSSIEKLVKSSEIVIDRPKGSVHPRFSDFIYKVDYGYLKDTASMDGAGIDVWVGTDKERRIDAVEWCRDKIKSINAVITRQGKNWYISIDSYEITVNVHSYTIITAHKVNGRYICTR